ncbi:unnamed protein product [Linum trigynum]|uniref:Uncharacterized protein n=1 Tax=Linum trigynum TaxID=586398 RepID=A0AAV2E6G9_9ROSI
MDPYDFSQLWGSPPTPKSGFPQTSWDNQERGSQGSGFYYQPPFQEEEPCSWGYQEDSPYQEGFPPQLEVKSKLELAMEAFMGQTLRPCATPQLEPKRKLELMVERFARGTDEGCSSKDLPIANHLDSIFLSESEELLRHTERLKGFVEQSCAQLAHNRLLPLEEGREVEEASHENFGRMSSDMDLQPLAPPDLTLEEKVARACASYRLSSLEKKEEVEGEINENRVEQDELTPESTHGEDAQEGCIDDFHALPESNFEDQVTSVEEQENPFYDLAWHLAIQTVLKGMNGKGEEEQEENIEKGEDLDCSQKEESKEEGDWACPKLEE